MLQHIVVWPMGKGCIECRMAEMMEYRAWSTGPVILMSVVKIRSDFLGSGWRGGIEAG